MGGGVGGVGSLRGAPVELATTTVERGREEVNSKVRTIFL